MSATERPTGYDELADVLESLPLILREARRMRGLSLRAAAKEVGVSFSTLTRFEQNDDGAQMKTVVAVMRWLDKRQCSYPDCGLCHPPARTNENEEGNRG